jgi:hypothetical protein
VNERCLVRAPPYKRKNPQGVKELKKKRKEKVKGSVMHERGKGEA